MSEKFYLKEAVFIDPLVNCWYAWPNLIPPVPYAMYMTKTHKRLMKSFVNNSALHILASQDPGMVGSSDFVNCSVEQTDQIKALLNKYETDYQLYQQLADAVKQLDEILKNHIDGTSIEHLYEQVPDLLKGYVEIHMDLYHHVSYRLLENLLYASHYYDRSIQSVCFGILSATESRPFVLSTPRFPDENHLHVATSFDSTLLDRIFRTRQEPVLMSEIDEMFGSLNTEGGLAYQSLFTIEKPSIVYQPLSGSVRLNYVGHAGLLVETSECAMLVDPVIAGRTEANANDVVSYSQLPDKIDYLCLTHNHSDHVNIETLLQLRYKIDVVIVPKNNGGSLADPSLKLVLQQLNFKVIEVEDMEKIPLPGGFILSIPFLGEHGDLNIRSKTGWYFELHGKKIYCGADSSNLEPQMYRHIHAQIGDLDILAIGMECVGAPYTWMYGALTTTKVSRKIRESRRLNGSGFEAAAKMTEILKPGQVLIYALGMEPWYGYFMGVDYDDESEQIVQSGQMLEYCEQRQIPCYRMCGKFTVDF